MFGDWTRLLLAPKMASTTVSPAAWFVVGSYANCRFSKTTMFPSNEAPLDPLVCWAVNIQENRQSLMG